MKILILNWRDIKNPSSGGAEILTHEMARRWVAWGHEVSQFSSKFTDSPQYEEIDGVKIIRRGHCDARYFFKSVHLMAFFYYQKVKDKIDVVIDEIHGLPFFTPWYVQKKKVGLICEVAGELWGEIFGPVFGPLGRITEKFYLHNVYKKVPLLTISHSTKKELIKEGVSAKNITILPMGVSVPKNVKEFKKEKEPTLIFVGRLTKAKGVEDVIRVLKQLVKQFPTIKLWIVGKGDGRYVNHLKELISNMGLKNRITFFGYLSDIDKFKLMSKAHILVHSSIKEGWGLTVIEAAVVGTPAIGYNVPGIREVIIDGRTGFLVEKNNLSQLTMHIVKMLSSKDTYEKLVKSSREHGRTHDWDKTARMALNVLQA